MVLAEKLVFAVIEFLGKFTIPTLSFVLLFIILAWQLKRIWRPPLAAKSPFSKEFIRSPGPLVMEKSKRDAVLKDVSKKYFISTVTFELFDEPVMRFKKNYNDWFQFLQKLQCFSTIILSVAHMS